MLKNKISNVIAETFDATLGVEIVGGNTGDYSSLENVKRELNYAQNIFLKYSWPVISVTNKPIEEISSEILAIKRRINPPEYTRKKCQ